MSEPAASPTAEPIIALDRVQVRFDRHAVLRHITLRLAPGRTLSIIGESGCGKTVLLKLIVGLIRPTAGNVSLLGKPLGTLSEPDLIKLRLRAGFLFQGSALFDSLNVYDNVAFGLRAARVAGIRRAGTSAPASPGSGVARFRRVQDAGGTVGGNEKAGGIGARVALDPEVMLYDEPTTGLDPIMSDVINELILQTRKRRPITSIVVTHDMKTARKVADRVIMLYPLSRLRPDEPQVLFDGNPDELAQHSDPRVRQFIDGNAGDRANSVENVTEA